MEAPSTPRQSPDASGRCQSRSARSSGGSTASSASALRGGGRRRGPRQSTSTSSSPAPSSSCSPARWPRRWPESGSSARHGPAPDLKGDHVVRPRRRRARRRDAVHGARKYLEGTSIWRSAWPAASRSPSPRPSTTSSRSAPGCGAEAHSIGIVHRDLKPGNASSSRGSRTARTGSNCSTSASRRILYDAPGGEQVPDRGRHPRRLAPLHVAGAGSRRRDRHPQPTLWAVGVILYYLVTGTFPFQGAKASDTMAHILHRAPQPPGERVPAVPKPLCEKIILRCPGEGTFPEARRRQRAGGAARRPRRRHEQHHHPARPAPPRKARPTRASPSTPSRRAPRWRAAQAAIAERLAVAAGVVLALVLRAPPCSPRERRPRPGGHGAPCHRDGHDHGRAAAADRGDVPGGHDGSPSRERPQASAATRHRAPSGLRRPVARLRSRFPPLNSGPVPDRSWVCSPPRP